jgi:ATP adenylyltransferase
LEHLWSPWRMEYLLSDKDKQQCVFCLSVETVDGFDNLVIYRGSYAFIILNRFPYTTGHLMIVPFLHKPSLEDLDIEIRNEIMELVTKSIIMFREEYCPEGFNVGMNIGEVSGAGIAEHVHIHVVPRWGGDTNFMSTLAGTRVLPESLDETYERIKQAWKKLEA